MNNLFRTFFYLGMLYNNDFTKYNGNEIHTIIDSLYEQDMYDCVSVDQILELNKFAKDIYKKNMDINEFIPLLKKEFNLLKLMENI